MLFRCSRIVGQNQASNGENRYLHLSMIPDYPHKIFKDKRHSYTLLMLTLAIDIAG